LASKATGRFYRPDLDGLRFLAFLAVFISHTLPTTVDPWFKLTAHWTPSIWAAKTVYAGIFGVHLFFTLSSFLITSLLSREIDTHPLSYIEKAKNFWENVRAREIRAALRAQLLGMHKRQRSRARSGSCPSPSVPLARSHPAGA